MAYAFTNLDIMNSRIRFLLFEIGIGFSESLIQKLLIEEQRSVIDAAITQLYSEGLLSDTMQVTDIYDLVEQVKAQARIVGWKHPFIQWEAMVQLLEKALELQVMKRAWTIRIDKPQQQEKSPYLDKLQQRYLNCPINLGCRLLRTHDSRQLLQQYPGFLSPLKLHFLGIRHHFHSDNTSYLGKYFAPNGSIMNAWREHLSNTKLDVEDYIPIPICNTIFKQLRMAIRMELLPYALFSLTVFPVTTDNTTFYCSKIDGLFKLSLKTLQQMAPSSAQSVENTESSVAVNIGPHQVVMQIIEAHELNIKADAFQSAKTASNASLLSTILRV